MDKRYKNWLKFFRTTAETQESVVSMVSRNQVGYRERVLTVRQDAIYRFINDRADWKPEDARIEMCPVSSISL